jgi:hypothetical protein
MLKKLKNLKKYIIEIIFGILLVLLIITRFNTRNKTSYEIKSPDTIKVVIKNYKDSIKVKQDTLEVIKQQYV